MNDPSLPNAAEVARLAAQIPVRASTTMTVVDCARRTAEVLRLLDIGAAELGGGIEYCPGVEPEDQPLTSVIENLVARRFGRPEQA